MGSLLWPSTTWDTARWPWWPGSTADCSTAGPPHYLLAPAPGLHSWSTGDTAAGPGGPGAGHPALSVTVSPLSSSWHMFPLTGHSGGAPGSSSLIKLLGAPIKLLVSELEWEDTWLVIVSSAASSTGDTVPSWLINMSPDPAQLIHHIGVDSRLASSPPTLWLTKWDDTKQHFSAIEVGCSQSSTTVTIAGVSNNLRLAARRCDQPGAHGTDLVTFHPWPEWSAVLGVHDADPGSLDNVGEDSGTKSRGNDAKPTHIHRGVTVHQVSVSHRVRETDWHHSAVVRRHLSLHLQQSNVMTSKYVIQLISFVPLGVDHDGLHLHAVGSAGLWSPGDAQVKSHILRSQSGAGLRTSSQITVLGWHQQVSLRTHAVQVLIGPVAVSSGDNMLRGDETASTVGMNHAIYQPNNYKTTSSCNVLLQNESTNIDCFEKWNYFAMKTLSHMTDYSVKLHLLIVQIFSPPEHSKEPSQHRKSLLQQSWCWLHWDKSRAVCYHRYLDIWSEHCPHWSQWISRVRHYNISYSHSAGLASLKTQLASRRVQAWLRDNCLSTPSTLSSVYRSWFSLIGLNWSIAFWAFI